VRRKAAIPKEERLVRLRALGYRVSWRRPFERSVDREQLRRRVLASTGLWFLLGGLLAALGFAAVLLVTFAVLLVVGVTAGGLWLLRRYRVQQGLRAALLSIERAFRQLKARLGDLSVRQHLQGFATRVRKMVTVASHRAGVLLARGGRSYATAVGRLRARTTQVLRTGGRLASSPSTREPAAVDRQHQALRLNELGAQLRRRGNHELAAEHHRAALAIVRDLGDRRAEALTLNNLALALAHTGGVATALQHFEQSLVVLRELGDEEHEGRVIANVGFVHRRQGRSEEAENLLHAALDKLPPESSAYREVEKQLRRAS
jgi:tetratricopeptide (TPR) repeat protein